MRISPRTGQVLLGKDDHTQITKTADFCKVLATLTADEKLKEAATKAVEACSVLSSKIEEDIESRKKPRE